MPIQHKDIPDANLHETKGIAAASIGTVQVASGAGTGTWQKVGSNSLKGSSGDAGVTNKILVSDGVNGFNMRDGFAYGSMGLINNTNAFTVPAAADATLSTNSDYTLFTGTGAPLAAGAMLNSTFLTNQLFISVAGVYKLVIVGQITAFPTTTARVGMKYRVAGGATSARRTMSKGFNAGDLGQFNMNEIITLVANDSIQLLVASSAAGGLIISDLICSLELIRAT